MATIIDASSVPIWFNILIYIQLYFSQYWYVLFPAIFGAIPLVLVRTFAMPLLTRVPHELVIIFSPRRATVLKVVSRYLPYFVHKQRLYWFDEPHQVGNNILHIYFEGVNQPITHLERIPHKESNILSLREYYNQTKSHHIILPPSLKSFGREWALIINDTTKKVELKTAREAGVKGKQFYKIGLLKRIGVFRVKQIEAQGSNSSASAKAELVTVTVQSIQQKLGDVVKDNNFSSRLAYKIIKKTRKIETDWIMMLTGAMDMKIVIVLLMIVLLGVAGYFIMDSLNLI